MTEYQHRSGALKQKNKKHKGGKRIPNGRIEGIQRKSIKVKQTIGKQGRLHRLQQLRASKKKLLVHRNRIGILR